MTLLHNDVQVLTLSFALPLLDKFSLVALFCYPVMSVPSEESEDPFEDVVNECMRQSGSFGILWWSFVKGSKHVSRVQGFKKFRDLVSHTNVANWYLGVTHCPSSRFWLEPSPHKSKYDVMHVIFCGHNMGQFEKNWLKLCKNEKVLDPGVNMKSRNIGPGGERCLSDGIRFMYMCLKYISHDCRRIEEERQMRASEEEQCQAEPLEKKRRVDSTDDSHEGHQG